MGYAPFDDTTKFARPERSSRVVAWAVCLHQGLQREFAGTGAGVPDPTRHRDLDATATLLRGVANQLPELAHQLMLGTGWWASIGALFAPERRLPRFETHNEAPTRPGRVVVADTADLAEVRTALEDAHTLSTGLSAELARTGDLVGAQPQPHLAAAHTEAAASLRPSGQDRRAQAARRRAQLVPPPQWGTRPAPRFGSR
jgi:hypothetical protein